MVSMSEIRFTPAHIRVSRGTKITWRNDESVGHYVNTDAHPSHTYFPDQNSKFLKQDDTFVLTLNTPGIYPYHCSAHAAAMKGSILVE
jgi:plastocyanin